MKWILLMVIYPIVLLQIASQPNFKELISYEGLFEYTDDTKLILAASEMDNTLYAIIDGAKYPLKFIAKDSFLNIASEPVVFHRNNGMVESYETGGQIYRLLNSAFEKPEFFPRKNLYQNPESYEYRTPENHADGLDVGHMNEAFGHPENIRQMIVETISGKYPDVHSILIYKEGKLVLEEYFYGYERNYPHQLRSATKPFIGALVGLAIDQGQIRSEKDPLLPYFTNLYDSIGGLNPLKSEITIENFLTYHHGMDCQNNNPESAGNELAMMNSRDWVKYTLDLPMVETPGKNSSYCSGCPLVLGKLVEIATRKKLEDFAKQYLFDPLRINNYHWRFAPDASSRTTFNQMYLRPRDLVKLAVMYLNSGKWNGVQIIPEEWVQKTFAPHDPEYGYLWEHQFFVVDGVRYNAYLASGNGGQKIHIWPEQNMVTVFTGGNYNSYLLYGKNTPPNEMIPKYILRAL